jgi:hypothetical protein
MASITCGKCRGTHDSVKEVRHCYNAQAEELLAPLATDRQLNFIMGMGQVRNTDLLGDTDSRALETWMDVLQQNTVTKREASHLIDVLHDLPYKPAATTVPEPTVPDGRYAIDLHGTLRFYVVSNVTEGKWAGRTFVSQMASDDELPVRDAITRNAILEIIARDPREAMIRYGLEIGRCGRCGRTLTKPESIAAGIGPVCAGMV